MFYIIVNILKLIIEYIVPFLPLVELILFILNNRQKEESVSQQNNIEAEIINQTTINIIPLQEKLKQEENRQAQLQKNMQTINRIFTWIMSLFFIVFFIASIVTNFSTTEVSLSGLDEISRTTQFLAKLIFYPIYQITVPLIYIVLTFSISNLIKNVILNKKKFINIIVGTLYNLLIIWLAKTILFSPILSTTFNDFSVTTNIENFSEILSTTTSINISIIFIFTLISCTIISNQFFIQTKFNKDLKHNLYLLVTYGTPLLFLFIVAWLVSPTVWPFENLNQHLHNLLNSIKAK